MCYDVESQLYRQIKEAHYKGDHEEARELEEKLRRIRETMGAPLFHASGFEHPDLLVFTAEEPCEPMLFNWGLIPFWVKDMQSAQKIRNNTLNARGETIFEKAAFREAAKHRRCLIAVDSFFEHHHYNGKTYPYRIKLKNELPMMLGGLWERWEIKETNTVKYTVAIVTTKANKLLEIIHNNPKMDEGVGSRMPLVLPKELQEEWLKPWNDETDKQKIQELIQPLDHSLFSAYTVPRLRGKNGVGNKPAALEEFYYPELEMQLF
ncbi:MAG TPA: SOS response-associated peptidase [Flavobacterium sp.]|nr:SOS response-associated peptidase [Flavobacterium sp.]